VDRLFLARHGESEYSVRGAVNGDPALAVGLTPEGRAQARRLGEALRGQPVELAAVTEFPRTRETAEVALHGRDVPFVVVPELNDIGVGAFEGLTLDEYRAWAWENDPTAEGPGGAESRAAVAARYARGFRVLLDRPERTILAVAHGLPVRYALEAAEGRPPPRRAATVDCATAYPLSRADLARVVRVLEEWSATPSWPERPCQGPDP
jgi:broad specificity phosphatase PhoE